VVIIILTHKTDLAIDHGHKNKLLSFEYSIKETTMAVITISRQFGAGGTTLARELSVRLDYDIASETIIEELAEQARVWAEALKSYEVEGGELRSRAPSLFSPKGFIEHIFDPKKKFMDGSVYASLLQEIIPKIAEKDNTIILGRGAQFILKNRPNTFHVLLIADRNDRIAFMMEYYDLSEDDARRTVNQQGLRRQKLMKLFSKDDYDKPDHYDLVLNLSKLSMDLSVKLVCDLIKPESNE